MKTLTTLLLGLFLSVATTASAQDFGVLESAETINRGNVKLGAYPLFIGPENDDVEPALGLAVGFGLTNALDLEGRAAFSSDVTFLGGDLEYWLLKNAPLDLSARGGFHVGLADGDGDSTGLDASLIGSAPVARRLEIYGALDLAFNKFDLPGDDWRNTVHVVPGIEFAVTDNLDVVAEFGIGVNDNAGHYFGGGLVYYVR